MSDDSPDCARDSIDLLYLDQGALLNLLVIGQASDILQALPYQCLITEGIRDAAYRFWGNALISELLPEGPQRTLSTLLLQGHLAIRSCDKLASLSTYLKLASRFPEPRASLLTLTVTMHAALLSDDRCTRSVLKDLFPNTPIISTLTLLYLWQKRRSLLDSALRVAAQQLRDRAYFLPSENDPLLGWWEHLLGV